MPAAVVLAVAIAALALAYRYYSAYLAKRVYALDPDFVTPAHTYNDGVDYVPTNKHIVFSHHFISVAGAAPIVGPATAVFWGWGPALLWVVLGTIFAAGVHDFGSLAISVRHKARSIGTLTSDIITTRARTLFLLIIFFLLTMVNAVFAVVIAQLFTENPEAVLPVLLTIPFAIGLGQYVYRKRTTALVPAMVAMALVYVSIPVGQAWPITVDPVANAIGLDAETLWILLIFVYTFFTSRLPVWMLLQPRDYINQMQMVVALAVIILGIVIGWNTIVAPAVNDVPPDSPPWFPLLFVTIACGAVSGFHSLVGSGTTAKQLDKETDARYVGYLASSGEGLLALCAILACTAGVAATTADWNSLYSDFDMASDSATGYFVDGVAQFAGNLGVPAGIGTIFASLVVISFAATSLDTAVRLQRYIVQDIAELVRFKPLARNLTAATVVAILIPLSIALLPGDFAFGTLWQLFGTTNQLTAGLALAVIAVWVTKSNRNPIAVLVPWAFLVVMTSWALIVQFGEFVASNDPMQMFFLAPLDMVIFVLALWMVVEAAIAFRRAWRERSRDESVVSPTEQS
ncbi:carbon starvation protein A [Allosaccharopolyspora coralli]|uniref:Carbon starvation protein A n=1 Tax=Allosaccharopolyspora coralli TaxID=2665642 RepID=A0A5Q3Q9Y4_9PSEU|nr:carbon starvation protein A [Allosaccharopolyspora coralli]QGK70166.1 carbon starvation protein A [Allosaccharopolyspora coralli]